ncbi:MAG: hypothetical protein N7Q72_02340, partial [Spiroplasma sp. Tabriz.8]|nr:hypothetical protein [Spiroplasma sp. Tabriz.8]
MKFALIFITTTSKRIIIIIIIIIIIKMYAYQFVLWNKVYRFGNRGKCYSMFRIMQEEPNST